MPTSLTSLKDGDVHLVLADSPCETNCGSVKCKRKCRKDKKAIHDGWQKRSASISEAVKHWRKGLYVGIIPGRSNLAVLDVDKGDPHKLMSEWIPIEAVDSPSGGKHLIYARPEDGIGNRKFEAYGCGGDVRCDAGYCVIWDEERWVKAIERAKSEVTRGLHPFPMNLLGTHKKNVTIGMQQTKVAVTPQMARAYLQGISPDVLYEDWIRVGQALHDAFNGSEEGFSLWDDWSRGGTKYDGNCRYHWNSFRVGGGVSWGTIVAMSSGKKVAAYTPGVEAPRGGTIVIDAPGKTPEAMFEALNKLQIQLRFNVRQGYAEITRPGSSEFMMLNKHTAAGTAWLIQSKCSYETKNSGLAPLFFTKEKREDCFNALLYREDLRVDPFEVFLESLPPWDKVERYQHWLVDLLGAEDTNLARWSSQYPFLGAVERCYEPGAKIDEIPVLIGREGIGKSTALRMIVPEDQPGLFGDGLELHETSIRQLEATLGRALIEISELSGMNRANSAKLKAFISRQDDGALRLAYGHGPEPRPRRFVMVGTTNEQDFLPNEKENRRWVPIVLGKSSMAAEEYFREEIDGHSRQIHMWSEALYNYKKGKRTGLPRTFKGEQREAAEMHRYRDDIMDEKIEELSSRPMSLREICKEMGIDSDDKRGQYRLRQALKTSGWTYVAILQDRPIGPRARLWYPPDYD